MKNTRVFPVKRLIRIVYAVMMFVILGTCIFGSGIYYSRKTDTVCAEPILFIGGVLITVVLAVVYRRILHRGGLAAAGLPRAWKHLSLRPAVQPAGDRIADAAPRGLTAPRMTGELSI